MNTYTKSSRLLRLLLCLSGSYPRTMEECTAFLQIKKSAFYNYCNELRYIGFDLGQKEGRYWIEAPDKASPVLANLLHFSEEEAYILARSIDGIEGYTRPALRLKQKLVAFLNHDKAVEAYLKKEKAEIVTILNNSRKQRKQVLLENYASGNSQTVMNRLVEPFEFNDDFNLVWAFDINLKKNRQFKICRMESAMETPLDWKYEREHRSMPVDVFRNSGSLDKEAVFEMNLRARNLLTEEYPLAEKYISPAGKNRFLFKVPVAKYEGPGRFVLGMAEDIELKGDGGFREYLKKKRENYAKLF